MKKNKIAGLVVASALLVGASSAAHTHEMVKNTNSNTNTNTKKTNEILLASANKQVTKNAMVVNGNNELVLRSSASSSSTIISNISVGEMLTIKSYSSNWYKVTVKETGSVGYIASNNIKFIENGVNYNSIDLNNNGKVINVSSALNLRSEPTLTSNVITTLENGTNFKIVASKGQWYQITVNGSTGFVYGGYVNVGSEIKAPTHMETKKEVISQKTSTTKVAKPVITKSETNAVTKTTVNNTTETKKITNTNSGKVQTTITPVKVEKTKKIEVKQPEIKISAASASVTKNNMENVANSFIVIPSNTIKNSKNNNIDLKNINHKDTTNIVAKDSNNDKISSTGKKEDVTHKEDNISKNIKISKSNSTKAKDDASKVINTNLNNNTNTSDTIAPAKNISTDNSKVTSKKVITPSETPASIVNNKTETSSNTTVKKDVSVTKNTESNNNNNNNNNNTSTTGNKHKEAIKQVVPEQGSLTLTMYQTNNDLALVNTAVTINGENYTTNSNGKVKISNIDAGNHSFNLSSKGYNNTSANINIKAGKNMNSIIYITKTVTHDVIAPKVVVKPIIKPEAKISHHDTVIPTPVAKPEENHKTTPTPIIKHNDANSQESNSELGQAIVNYAEQFIGRPYVWGATGPNSFDCSGLTYYVYKHFGYYIGCTTYTQIDKGTPVSINNLQAGDLIFWGDPSAPYHVAIYIGGGQYIQAPHTGATVDISSWNLSNISAARRII